MSKLILLLFGALAVIAGLVTSSASQEPKKKSELRSLSTLSDSDLFESSDGRFRIKLPLTLSAHSAITSKEALRPATGTRYEWTLKEGHIALGYVDELDDDFSKITPARIERLIEARMERLLRTASRTRMSEDKINSGSILGRKLKFRIEGVRIGMIRIYVDRNRVYTIIANVEPGVKKAEKLIETALDSFVILEQPTANSPS